MNWSILWISPLRGGLGSGGKRVRVLTRAAPTPVVTRVVAQLSSPLAQPQNGHDAGDVAWDSGQGANLSGKGRPMAPAPRWWGDRPGRRPARTPRDRRSATWSGTRAPPRSRRAPSAPSWPPSHLWGTPAASTSRADARAGRRLGR